MVTRKIKPTAAAFTPIEEVVHAAPTYRDRLHAMLDEALSGEQPSWKRTITAWVIGLSAAFGVGYLTGMVTGYVVIGATVMGAPAFVALILYILGILLAMYLGNKVALFAYMKVMDKSVDAAFSTATNKVRGWFGSSAIKTVAA